jgi:hypothetical protein
MTGRLRGGMIATAPSLVRFGARCRPDAQLICSANRISIRERGAFSFEPLEEEPNPSDKKLFDESKAVFNAFACFLASSI